jgi:phosphoribosylaminoimidazole-succinocarboxamide synthase
MPDEVRVGAAERYITAYEQITGESFVPDLEPPQTRMARHLEAGAAQ